MLESLYDFILLIHIIAGCIALPLGTVIIALKKGDSRHKKMGKIYYYAMMINTSTGFYIAYHFKSMFLLIIAVFSFYLIYTGNRVLHHKKLFEDKKQVHPFDWFLAIASMLFCSYMVYRGVLGLKYGNTMAIVIIVFSVFCIVLCYEDIMRFRGKIHKYYGKQHWLFLHIIRMMGSYIAAVTAFLVNNVHTQHQFIWWLLPSVILSPLISRFVRKYESKLKIQRPRGIFNKKQ